MNVLLTLACQVEGIISPMEIIQNLNYIIHYLFKAPLHYAHAHEIVTAIKVIRMPYHRLLKIEFCVSHGPLIVV